MSQWTPVEWAFVIGAVFSGICSAISAWQSKGTKERVADAAGKSALHGAVSLTHLEDLKIGTEAIRTQTNGNTDRLLAQNRDLLTQLNQILVENGKLATEVAGLRTARTGGRVTDRIIVPTTAIAVDTPSAPIHEGSS